MMKLKDYKKRLKVGKSNTTIYRISLRMLALDNGYCLVLTQIHVLLYLKT